MSYFRSLSNFFLGRVVRGNSGLWHSKERAWNIFWCVVLPSEMFYVRAAAIYLKVNFKNVGFDFLYPRLCRLQHCVISHVYCFFQLERIYLITKWIVFAVRVNESLTRCSDLSSPSWRTPGHRSPRPCPSFVCRLPGYLPQSSSFLRSVSNCSQQNYFIRCVRYQPGLEELLVASHSSVVLTGKTAAHKTNSVSTPVS